MKVKAIQSFIGRISMNIDDEREIIDEKLAKELINAGHVIEIKAAKKEVKKEAEPVKEVEKVVEETVEEKPTRKKKSKK